MRDSVTRLDYCQYLLVSQINYTLTNFVPSTARSFLTTSSIGIYEVRKLLLGALWENVAGQVVQTENGYLVFDDTVLDKNHAFAIELVRRQYSGNAHGVIKGIGVVTCVHVNPELDQFWVIDYRIYDLDGDGKSKLDHVREMLSHTVAPQATAVRSQC